MPASFSNATAILQMSFLNPLNSLGSSNFLKISTLHSTSVCCFTFLALDLLAISALAFAHALALVQGVQEVVWLQKGISREKNDSNNTYSKFWGTQSILKSTYLSHRLPPPTMDIPISLANSSHHWQASRVSFGRYQTCCLLVRGGRSMRFISLLEGVEGSKKIFAQFFRCCCSMAATWSALRR